VTIVERQANAAIRYETQDKKNQERQTKAPKDSCAKSKLFHEVF
jgi:hypothetical protein